MSKNRNSLKHVLRFTIFRTVM